MTIIITNKKIIAIAPQYTIIKVRFALWIVVSVAKLAHGTGTGPLASPALTTLALTQKL